jgi:hypothetical protein
MIMSATTDELSRLLAEVPAEALADALAEAKKRVPERERTVVERLCDSLADHRIDPRELSAALADLDKRVSEVESSGRRGRAKAPATTENPGGGE